jgi:hypothetical protein
VLLRLEITCYFAPSRLALDAHCSPKKNAIYDLPRYKNGEMPIYNPNRIIKIPHKGKSYGGPPDPQVGIGHGNYYPADYGIIQAFVCFWRRMSVLLRFMILSYFHCLYLKIIHDGNLLKTLLNKFTKISLQYPFAVFRGPYQMVSGIINRMTGSSDRHAGSLIDF